jgi:hypothetical protein
MDLIKEFNFNEMSINELEFFLFEEYIILANKKIEEQEKHRKSDEDKQKMNMPNLNPNQYMSGMNNMASKFKR